LKSLQLYKLNAESQIAAIRKLSNIAILVIWFAGFCSIVVFVAYFLYFSSNSGQADNSYLNAHEENEHVTDADAFDDKTTLVNIGLKMQEMATVGNDIKTNGSIRIHKIKYDQQVQKSVIKPAAAMFDVKPIPK
jgi:hypothetical protein